MSDDQFNRIFTTLTTITGRLDAIDHTLKTEVATKAQVSAVYDLLDKNIKEHKTQEEERAAMAAQLKRLEGWVQQLADQAGVTLHYE